MKSSDRARQTLKFISGHAGGQFQQGILADNRALQSGTL